jgi:dTDP-glucose 4,6-dehydratase
MMRVTIYSKTAQRLIDAAIVGLAWFAAYQIRFEGQVPAVNHRQLLLLLLPVVAAQIGTNALLGIYRYQWRYIRAEDALYIARAYLCVPTLLLLLRVFLGSSAKLFQIPLSVIATTFVLAVVGAICVRMARRLVYQRLSDQDDKGAARRFLLVGAGLHGVTVAREMVQHKGIKVVGFVDDDPEKQGAVIAGVPVIGRVSDLRHIVASSTVDEVLVCVTPRSRHLLQIGDLESSLGSPVRSRLVPTLEEILEASSLVPAPPARELPNKSNGNGNGNGQAAMPVRTTGSPVNNNGGKGATSIQSKAVPGSCENHSSQRPVVENKTILITGGAGFIGSSLAEKFVENNAVVLLDQCFDGSPIQYTSLLKHPNLTAVKGNILETDLRSLVRESDVIVHTAAILGVNRVCSSARETLETNYVGTSRLLKALEVSSNLERFVYFSTSEVFGVNSYRVDEASRPSVGPIAESRWSYAMSKLAGEHLVASYYREAQLPIVIVRPFNIFGPRRTGDYALRRFILSALRNEPLEIHGDGTQIRSWCYIEDFCSALLRMISRAAAVGEDFNIGHPGNTLTVYDLARTVLQIAGSTSPIQFCQPPFPDISIRVPSLEKARRLLEYEPQYDLTTGLELTIQWFRKNFARFPSPVRTTSAALPSLVSDRSAA